MIWVCLFREESGNIFYLFAVQFAGSGGLWRKAQKTCEHPVLAWDLLVVTEI